MESFKVFAPTRADLAGGTLDIWPLNCLLGGAKTINVALGLHATAAFEVVPSSSFKMEVQSHFSEGFTFEEPLSLVAARKLSPALQFPVAVLSEYLRQQKELPNKFVKVRLETEAPLRSGLGGSSALCVAMIRGVSRLFHDYVEQGWQWRLLNWVKDMEASFLGVPTGTQDYLAALFGGLRCYHSNIGNTEAVAYSDAALKGLSERMVVLFSGEMHQSGLSNWEVYKSALEGGQEVLRGLSSLKSVADHLDQELRASELNWKRIGKLFDEEWHIRKTLLHVETPRLEEIISFLKERKVLGGKVCGAAQGGSLLALVEPGQRAEFAESCKSRNIKVLETSVSVSGVTIQNS